MSCRALSTDEELDAACSESFERPLVLLKHSAWCGLSEYVTHAALRELDRWTERVGCRLVIVQDQRKLSDAIARRFGIRHETPQLLLIRDGRLLWHASHLAISDRAVRRAIEEAIRASSDPHD